MKLLSSLKYSILMLLSSCFGFGDIKSRPEDSRSDFSGSGVDSVSIYDFKVLTLEGDTLNFQALKGKKILIVNTASKCGFTPQYEDLEQLHKTYGDKVTVIGFPCNQFGGQEPGTSNDIAEFCQRNYGVTFQMMSKVDVKGNDVSPIYQWLTDSSKNGWNSQQPTWNFCKYLISEDGKLLKYFGSSVKPLDKEITDLLK